MIQLYLLNFKKISLLTLSFICLFFLTSCQTNNIISDVPANSLAESDMSQKKPRIPSVDLKASILSADYKNSDVNEMKDLLEEIDKDLISSNITEEDIRRGWYAGSIEDKKYGTPEAWIWQKNGINPRWISPNSLDDVDYVDSRGICNASAGSYHISCIDTEETDCEYIPKTECICIENTKWVDDQGCILLKDEKLVSISVDELRRGWYNGLTSEKKLNTPLSWIWIEDGQKSRWKNPSPK